MSARRSVKECNGQRWADGAQACDPHPEAEARGPQPEASQGHTTRVLLTAGQLPAEDQLVVRTHARARGTKTADTRSRVATPPPTGTVLMRLKCARICHWAKRGREWPCVSGNEETKEQTGSWIQGTGSGLGEAAPSGATQTATLASWAGDSVKDTALM